MASSAKSNENIINSRLKMFQNVPLMASTASSSSRPPPPLPTKPTTLKITTEQANSAAKFVKNNVKVSHVVAAMEIGNDIYGEQQKSASETNSKNANLEIDTGKVLAKAKLIQSMNSSKNSTNFCPSKPLPPLPTIVKKNSLPTSKSNDFGKNSNVKELSSKLFQENQHAPTVIRPQMRPKTDNFDQKSSSVKALRADLETKLNFGPPTVVYGNRRRSSASNQDYNANLVSSVSFPSNFDDETTYNSYPRMLPVTQDKSKSQPVRPPPPVQSPPSSEPHCTLIYDFNGQQSDELSCKAGERVVIKNDVDNEWIYAFNPRTQRSGIVPKSYLDFKVVPQLPSQAPKSPPMTNKNDVWDDDSGVDSAHDGPRCYTLHDFNSGEQGDLAFCQGEIVRLTARIDVQWLEGEAHDGRRGIFPSSFVEIIEDLPSVDNSPRTASGFSGDVRRNSSESHQKTRLAVALYDFYGQNEGDLSFNAGEQIEVTNIVNDEWLEGRLVSSGKNGIFPSQFVEYSSEELSQKNLRSSTNMDTLVGKTVVALYEYKSDQPSDLCFEAGDEIEILNVVDGDWMEGRLNVGLSNKRCWPVGLFPRNYVNFGP